MARSAKRPEKRAPKPGPLEGSVLALGGMISRNPVLVGGSTAFLVALFYVSANALWYQPHAHTSAFFATREFSLLPARNESASLEPETTIQIERPEEVPAAPVRPKSDPAVEQVQAILKDLNFYAGTVDGIPGPATTKAIETYQRKMGLTPSGKVDQQLLSQLGANPTTAGITPAPAPRPAPLQQTPTPIPAVQPVSAPAPSPRVSKIQAGLKAFGNDGIEIDGLVGARTKSAIREFQSLFGLPETGEPDEAVYVKMKEIGLTK
ncbi:peptidoglycan-binding protein [Mesorhizobium sp. YR577]|uniref:peptidoglycan-binding domain-containing protein n=1 Tax=Mesorhizobium sp. YR577 TaxID=1884373 RepID=UPI0008E7915F|nr:peptidoglycan-binding protein [Mesorhizobium sp. YR577]SFT96469.1 Peptidoglycan-binding (PGRP) domain of peptidoglycan hydrolases-containing protein [Mesorhizobium sp. YR577]